MSNRTRLFVNELVEKYHLGTPQKVYAQRWKYYVMVICASLLFVLWIFTILVKYIWNVLTLIDNFNYIFIPNVLNFRKPYGTINRGFPFRSGQSHSGEKAARDLGNFHG